MQLLVNDGRTFVSSTLIRFLRVPCPSPRCMSPTETGDPWGKCEASSFVCHDSSNSSSSCRNDEKKPKHRGIDIFIPQSSLVSQRDESINSLSIFSLNVLVKILRLGIGTGWSEMHFFR